MYRICVAPTTKNPTAQFYQTFINFYLSFINNQRYKNCIRISNTYSSHQFLCKVDKQCALSSVLI